MFNRSRKLHYERGTAAIVLAVSVTVIFGAAAIVLDAGDIWQERRQLVGATDAAALAAAQDMALGYSGCTTTADDYLESNSPGAVITNCTTSSSSSGGSVEIEAAYVVEHNLAKILGRSQTTVTSSSGARWGTPSAASGLRPFALCNQSDGFIAWQSSGHSLGNTFRITYDKSHVDNCGGPAPGNWGLLDFDGGANSNNDTQEWVLNGYPGLVPASWISGDPGAFSSSLPISSIAGDVIQLPVFNDYSEGGGAGASFNVIGYVSLRIVEFQANGPEASRYLDVQFETDVIVGSCCTLGGLDTGSYVVTLCAAEQTGSCTSG